ncbi:MAG: glycosyltransferase [Terriglobia bacterium]
MIERDLDGVVVLDPALKEGLSARLKLTRAAAQRIRVLPHGIGDPVEISSKSEARRRLGLESAETVFLVFGILRKDKRIDLAIEAAKALADSRLVIAGGPHDFTEAAVKELIHRHECESSVLADIGYVPEEKMHAYFSACDAVVIPYDRSFKGLSGILTLACGHGKPVIASNVSLLGETVRQRQIGFAVEPDSASALTNGMLQFLSMATQERVEMEQRVRDYAASMSWDSVCRHWLEFYQDLLKRRKSLMSSGYS